MNIESGINYISLFDGMGGAAIALRELGILVNKGYASENDPHAIKQSKLNFPDVIHLGDVRTVDVSKLPEIDLLFGGSPCFVASTSVLTSSGHKHIEDIVPGDMVLTHTGKYQKVLKIGNKKAKTFNLSAQGLLVTTTTSDHPYYIREMTRKWDNEKRTSYRSFSEPVWKEVKDIKKGDFIGIPIPTVESNPLNITDDEALLIGRYIADGHTRKDYRSSENRPHHRYWQLIISVGKDKSVYFNQKYKLKHSFYKHTDSCYRAVFSSKRLVEIVEENCGCGAKNKFISNTLLNLPIEKLKLLLKGYIEGDGYLKGNKYRCDTISKNLVLSLTLAIHKCYRSGISVYFNKNNPTHVIEGRTVNQSDSYTLDFRKYVTKQANYKVIDNIVWYPIRNIEETGIEDTVYNIQVDGDESYTANNAIVHNCTDLSFAGKQSGLIVNSFEDYMELRTEYLKTGNEDLYYHNGKFQQSILFWEYLRILKDLQKVNPDVLFLLENVGMKKVFQKQFNDNLGIYPVNLNSNLVSAQNRNRWYWTNIRTKSVGLFGELHSDIPQPKDRGILLKDILQDESEVDEKYYLSDKMVKHLIDNWRFAVAELNKKSRSLDTKPGGRATGIFIKLDKQGNKKPDQDKAGCLTAGGHSGGNHSDMDIICVAMRGREDGQELEPKTDGKTNCLTSVSKDNLIMQINPSKESGGNQPYQQNRIYDTNGQMPALTAELGGRNNVIIQRPHGFNKGGVFEDKSPTLTGKSSTHNNHLYDGCTLRRLTEKECNSLQTIPGWYVWECSSTQHYRMLGNGFTIEVIKWILSFLLKT
jgi:DNA (cytosine-5)-methyltransferase 3A